MYSRPGITNGAWNPQYTFPNNDINIDSRSQDEIDIDRYKKLYRDTGDAIWLDMVSKLEGTYEEPVDWTYHKRARSLLRMLINDMGIEQGDVEDLTEIDRYSIGDIYNRRWKGVSAERAKSVFDRLNDVLINQ